MRAQVRMGILSDFLIQMGSLAILITFRRTIARDLIKVFFVSVRSYNVDHLVEGNTGILFQIGIR